MSVSQDPTSAPIQTTSNDVLLYIFAVNANMFADKKALHTTRISSQVCRRWRDLMLDRPFLWARLIDMEEIRHASTPQRWWNVLIQRSGAALLWIRAESESFRRSHPEATDNSIKLEQLFFGFINSNWHRIQRLVIDGNYPAPGLTHAMVSFPAPQLKEFEMPLPKETGDSRSGDLDNEGTITTPIFSGHAPLLRRFRCVGYIVDRQAPWLGNLHSIELNRLYSISDALAVLSAAHSLTEIIIDKLVDGKPSEPLFNVSLPRLKSFRCEASPQPCARLLGQLEFPLGCSMNIHISKYNDPNSIAEENPYLLQVVNIFSLYTKRHLQSSHILDTLDLHYIRYVTIYFGGETTNPVECRTRFDLAIPLQGDFRATLLSMFMSQLGRLDLSGVRTLHLFTNGGFNLHFESLLSSLPSLHTICAHADALEYLMDLQDLINISKTPNILFPLLKVIRLVDTLMFPIASQIQAAGKFILSRARSGYPVSTLDASKCSPLKALPNLYALSEVEGLKLLYKSAQMEGIVEHVCGSGDPKKHTDTT